MILELIGVPETKIRDEVKMLMYVLLVKMNNLVPYKKNQQTQSFYLN